MLLYTSTFSVFELRYPKSKRISSSDPNFLYRNHPEVQGRLGRGMPKCPKIPLPMLEVVAMTSGAQVLSLTDEDLEVDAGADPQITVRGLKEPGLQCLGCC